MNSQNIPGDFSTGQQLVFINYLTQNLNGDDYRDCKYLILK